MFLGKSRKSEAELPLIIHHAQAYLNGVRCWRNRFSGTSWQVTYNCYVQFLSLSTHGSQTRGGRWYDKQDKRKISHDIGENLSLWINMEESLRKISMPSKSREVTEAGGQVSSIPENWSNGNCSTIQKECIKPEQQVKKCFWILKGSS